MSHTSQFLKAVIVDASVVVKWYVSEVGSPAANRWREQIASKKVYALAPPLLLLEVTNVLLRKYHQPKHEVLAVLDDLDHLEIDFLPPKPELMVKVVDLAYQYDLTSYDAFYVAMSEDLGIPVLTDDKAMISAMPGLTRKL